MKKVILITGTRKGIGKELAEYYLSLGCNVIGCSRGPGTIVNSDYRHYELDVSNEKDVVKMVRAVKKEFERIDILLNNAGIASMNHFLTTPYQTVQNIFNTNFFGTFLFSREVSKVMIRQKYGRIITISSLSVPLLLRGTSAYTATKSAIVDMTKVLAKELAPTGVTCNVINPGLIETGVTKNFSNAWKEMLLNKQTIKSTHSIEELCNIIDFFIGNRSSCVTGQVISMGLVT